MGPNLIGMFIGLSSKKYVFFVRIAKNKKTRGPKVSKMIVSILL